MTERAGTITRAWRLASACAVLAAAISITQSAQAQGAQLCGRISTQSDQLACTQAVAGQRVDAAAAQLCGRISTNSDIVECARAIAGRAFPSEGAELCGRISTNSDIVRCARAVAGYTLDAGAARVCSRISTNSDITACAEAIRNKTYAPEELALCGRNGSNRGIVDCMRATGRVPEPPRAAPSTSPAGAPRTATPTRLVIVNNTDGALSRIYVRYVGTPWPAAAWRGTLSPSQQQPLDITTAGHYGVCVETPTGYSLYWADLVIGPEGLTLPVAGDPNWAQMDCHTR